MPSQRSPRTVPAQQRVLNVKNVWNIAAAAVGGGAPLGGYQQNGNNTSRTQRPEAARESTKLQTALRASTGFSEDRAV